MVRLISECSALALALDASKIARREGRPASAWRVARGTWQGPRERREAAPYRHVDMRALIVVCFYFLAAGASGVAPTEVKFS